MKTKWILVLLFVLGAILAFTHQIFRERRAVSSATELRTPSRVEEAMDTCVSDSESQRIVVLHVANSSVSIDSDSIGDGQLQQRLREIYRARPERLLYLLPDKDASFQRIAEVVRVVRHLRAESSSESPLPKELQRPTGELMNVQIRLVTERAIKTPCPKGYFNWATRGLLVYP